MAVFPNYLVFLILIGALKISLGFNIDTSIFNEYTIPQPGKFGYSLAFHETLYDGKNLLVGAPSFKSVSGSVEDGAIFKCNPDSSSPCTVLNTRGPEAVAPDFQRNGEWMGMSLKSVAGEGVLACAPRYMRKTTFNLEDSFWMQGRCTLLNEDYTFSVKLEPCRELPTGNANYGYCLAGLSADMAFINQDLHTIISMPGAVNLRGEVAIQRKVRPTFVAKTQSSDVLMTSSMMGYSVSYGNFTAGRFGDFAGGAPTASKLLGRVIIHSLTTGLPIAQTIDNPDKQVGSYFGGSVCAVDLNNDGMADLLVGAPFYSVTYNEGRVYIYLNKKGTTFGGLDKLSPYLDGDAEPGAKFGSTIVSVGDLNQDGYGDVAIGAPLGGGDGKGAIYIYNGGPDGFRNNFKYSQRIKGSRFGVETFGSAITGGMDMDGNSYKDIAVGSYGSNKAHLFKTRSILTLMGSLSTNTSQVPADAAKANCVFDKTQYNCISLDLKLEFNVSDPEITEIDVEVTYDLDRLQSANRRAAIVSGGKLSHSLKDRVKLLRDGPKTISKVLFITVTGLYDLLQPISLGASFQYLVPVAGCGTGKPCPIMNIYEDTVSSSQVTYQKGCDGDGNPECLSDLVVDASIDLPDQKNEKEIVYGLVYQVNLVTTVENKGENAYQSMMTAKFSTDMEIIGVDIQGESYPLWEKEAVSNMQTALKFPLASPLKEGQKLNILIKLAVKANRPASNKMSFELSAISVSMEKNAADNTKTLSIGTAIQTCVKASIDISPNQVYYTAVANPRKVVNYTDIGKEVTFTFFIQNNGRLPVEQVSVNIDLAEKKGGNFLLYVAELMLDGSVCADSDVDPLNITRSQNRLASPSRKRRDNQRLDCRSAVCKTFECKINRLESGKDSTIMMKARVWEESFYSQFTASDLVVSMSLEFTGPTASLIRHQEGCATSYQDVLTVQPAKKESKTSVAWWVILLAVLGGLLLIAIAIIVLYKVGFFKRNRKIKQISSPEEATQKPTADDDYEDGEE